MHRTKTACKSGGLVMWNDPREDVQGNLVLLPRDPYYWVKFVQRILELLTDLCIGRKLG